MSTEEDTSQRVQNLALQAMAMQQEIKRLVREHRLTPDQTAIVSSRLQNLHEDLVTLLSDIGGDQDNERV